MRTRSEGIAHEESWLREHHGEYERALARLSAPDLLRGMLSQARQAKLTLECWTSGDSGEKACYLVGQALAQLDRALEDQTLVQTYEARERSLAAMRSGSGELPDLGLGLVRSV